MHLQSRGEVPHSEYQRATRLIPRRWLYARVNPCETSFSNIYHGLRGWYVLTVCKSTSDHENRFNYVSSVRNAT